MYGTCWCCCCLLLLHLLLLLLALLTSLRTWFIDTADKPVCLYKALVALVCVESSVPRHSVSSCVFSCNMCLSISQHRTVVPDMLTDKSCMCGNSTCSLLSHDCQATVLMLQENFRGSIIIVQMYCLQGRGHNTSWSCQCAGGAVCKCPLVCCHQRFDCPASP